MADDDLYPFLPAFFCDDVYWLVTTDGVVHGLLVREEDARRLFDATDPDAMDGDVHLWRLNGGYLCRPHVAAKSPRGVAAAPAPITDIKARDAIEAKAREIYDGWKHLPGWVPWVEGGNSLKQDEARRAARAPGVTAAPRVTSPALDAVAYQHPFPDGVKGPEHG